MDINKYNKLIKISNPDKVYMNAKKYFNNDFDLRISTQKNKKYMVWDPNNNKYIHFGSFEPAMEDFTKHENNLRKNKYILRSSKIKGDWKNNKYSPNNLSINLLWK